MTSFARYYTDKHLNNYSMADIQSLISDESNKETLAEIIYHRYYDRYLKIFYFSTQNKYKYTKVINGIEVIEELNDFDTEFKSGFAIMTNCCLLIEVISAYFKGQNHTLKSGSETFNTVFKRAHKYSNDLSNFENKPFYKNIRCGLLHQGETYGKFKIRRDGILFDEPNFTINAKLFCDNLKDFLKSYMQELKEAEWNSEIWDNCRVKLRHIIKNSF